jgi:hypothetical protein
MNVAFEQIHRAFEVPKPVMHLIVHHVRPRAPPPPAEWHVYHGRHTSLFGEWMVVNPGFTTRGTLTRPMERPGYWCSYCLTGPFAQDRVCDDCAGPVLEAAKQYYGCAWPVQ